MIAHDNERNFAASEQFEFDNADHECSSGTEEFSDDEEDGSSGSEEDDEEEGEYYDDDEPKVLRGRNMRTRI